MLDRMNVAGESRKESFSSGGVGLGRHVRSTLNPGPQPVTDRTERYRAFFVGYIANSEELWETIDPAIGGDGRQSDAALALAHFLQHGEQGLARLNGVFAAAVYDKNDDVLTLFTDRYGYQHVYYTWDGKRFFFSSNLDAVVKASDAKREVDFDAVCDMLIYHFVCGSRTLLQGAHLLPNAAFCTVKGEEFLVRRYWEFPSDVEICQQDMELFVEPAIAKVTDSMKRLAGKYPDIAVPLSGGLDSRFLAGLAVQEGRDVKTFFSGASKSKEAGYSQRIAETLEVPWKIFDLRECDYKQLDASFDQFNDGSVNSEMRLYLPMMQHIGEHLSRTVTVVGLCLDSLLEPARRFQFAPDAPCGNNGKGLYQAVYQGYSQLAPYLADEVFPSPISERMRIRRFSSVEETLEGFPQGNAWERTRYFYYVNRGRRLIHSGNALYSCVCDLVYPGLDYDLFDYAITIPYEYLKLLPARLYRRIIQVFNPRLGEIPWDLTGLPLNRMPSERSGRLNAKTNQIKYYAGRLSHGLLDFSVPANSPNRLFRHNKGFRRSVLEVLQDSRTQSRGIIDKRGVDKLIRLQDSGRNHFALIWALLTVEKFFRKVIDD